MSSLARSVEPYEHGPLSQYVAENRMSLNVCGALREALRFGQGVLVSGPRRAGKTTLLNALLVELFAHCPLDRVIVLERERQLRCSSRRATPLLVKGSVSAAEVLRSALRLNPDRVVVGELAGAEALGAVRAWSGSQPGGLATIRALSACEALVWLEQLTARGTPGFVPRAEISAAIGLLGHLAKGPRGPFVMEAQRMRGLDGRGEYLLEVVP